MVTEADLLHTADGYRIEGTNLLIVPVVWTRGFLEPHHLGWIVTRRGITISEPFEHLTDAAQFAGEVSAL